MTDCHHDMKTPLLAINWGFSHTHGQRAGATNGCRQSPVKRGERSPARSFKRPLATFPPAVVGMRHTIGA